MDNSTNSSEFSLETVVSSAIKIPGVRVKRQEFLAKAFADVPEKITQIVSENPISADVPRNVILKKAKKLIATRTSESSAASFLAGIPGGIAMAATIPADILQFFGMTLRLAQELSYLYGAEDLWYNGEIDDEKVRNQLILYCGVMFGVSGASTGVRVLSSQIAKTTLKKLPQKALTKTFWYPIIKKICAAIGIKMTKTTLAQGLNKAIPVIGGALSGGITFASMMPMANRLLKTLDKAAFDYSETDFEADIIEIEEIRADKPDEVSNKKNIGLFKTEAVKNGTKIIIEHTVSRLSKAKDKIDELTQKSTEKKQNKKVLKNLDELRNLGVISDTEYEEKKQCFFPQRLT